MLKPKQNTCQSCGARLPVGVPAELCPFCPPPEMETEGGRVLGDCEIFEEIGRGGMGVVWRGRQRGLNREVAVKTLPGGDLAGADARARFRTEAQAAARLKHPGIVAIYDVGEEHGMPYFVMELVRGQTLGTALSGKPAGVRIAARWLRDAALAVQHAHENGVLHRDIKPSNILIENSADGGSPRVMDFGLAKLTDIENSLTLTGSAAGSPAYMSPEQARSGESTARSDVYGLGAVLYTALTARAPFHGESLAAVLAQVERDEPIAPRRLNPSIPRDLETICLKCLEKKPANRYPTAQEIADDLTRFLDSEPVRARPVGPAGKMVRFARRRPWQAAAVLLAIAMLAGVIFSLAWKAETEHRHQQTLSLITMRAQLSEARAIIRLHEFNSRVRAEEIVRSVVARNPPADIRDEARDVAIAALALPSAKTEPLSGEGTVTHDWTFALGDLARERWALADFEGNISIRGLVSGNIVSSFKTSPRKVSALVAFSPGGRWLAIRHFDELCIWDTTPGAQKPLAFSAKPWSAPNRFGFMKMAFGPDEASVLWCDGAALVATSLPDGAELKRWEGISAQSFGFDADGKSFSVASSTAVELRRWPGGEILRAFPNTDSQERPAVAVAKNANFVACGNVAGRITVWSHVETDPPIEFRGHNEAIRGLAFSPDGRFLASSSEGGDIRLWDCTAAELVATTSFDVGVPSFSPDMKRIGVGCADGKLSVFSAELSPCFHSIQLPVWDRTHTVEFFPDSKSILSTGPSGVRRYSIPGGGELQRIPFVSPTGMVVEKDARAMVIAGAQGVARVPLDATGNIETLLPKTRGYWEGLTSSADGQWLAVSDPAFLRIALWKAPPAPFEPRMIAVAPAGPSGLALCPDGKTIAATHQYAPGIVIIDSASGEITRRLTLPPQHDIAWSPDGRFLAASGSTAQMWDTQTWRPLALPPVGANVTPAGACAFAPINGFGRSSFLATALNNSRIRLIELETLTTRATLQSPHELPILRMRISADGKWLAAGAARGRIQLWDLPAIEAHLRSLGLSW